MRHPGRRASQLEEAEREFGGEVDVNGGTEGVAIAGMLLGNLTSSLRAELGGLLAGLTCPLPLHIGTDSMSMVEKLAVLTQPQRRKCRPLGLTKDGDLWEQVLLGWRTRGPDATRITWGRSHQGFSAIVWHGADPIQVSQNGIVDEVAGRGAIVHGWRGQEQLLKSFNTKRRILVELLQSIPYLLISTLKAEKLLREPEVEEKQAKKTARIAKKNSERISPPSFTAHTPLCQEPYLHQCLSQRPERE